jgi:hypothetical protein
MGKVSKGTTQEHFEAPGVEGHYGELDGYTIGFESYSAQQDLAPLFVGLPNDQCQSRHWGYVIRGKVGFKHDGGEEIFSAGDAYVVGPGHTPVFYPDTEVVEFSPSDELAQTMEVVSKNLEAAGATS